MIPFRSLLNVPGDRPDMIAKAPGYGADALILDLEDAVAADAKAAARATVADTLAAWASEGRTAWVRVNGLETPWLDDDLTAIVGPGLAGIQLPKVHGPDIVREVDAQIRRLERERGLGDDRIALLVSLESARGVHLAFDILSAASRIFSVMVGTAQDADLQGDVGYVTTDDGLETLYIRSSVLLAARAAGVPHPIDGVYADHRDPAGLERVARRARELGYRGKKLIHPGQIAVVHRVFTPTPAELDHYRRVIDAFDAALAEGRATAVADGRMVDVAMAETARRVLAEAGALPTDDPPEGGSA